MGKASSAKKIKRVQQAGVSRTPGQRRNLAYPALIIGILVVGCVLVWVARESRVDTVSVAPSVDDEWFDPFGVDVCGSFQGNFGPEGDDSTGIGTNGNGLIRIAPSSEESAGDNATFDKFLASVGISVAEGTFTLPDGTVKSNGDPCGEAAGRVALYIWPPQANPNTEPRIVTQATQINSARFTEDGQIFVLAFAPEDAEPQLPPSVEALGDPTAAPEAGGSSEDTTTTSAPAASSTEPSDTTTTTGG